MSNQLPAYITVMKSTLPQVCTRYEIRNPVYHLPNVRHTFAEQSLRYCLIKHLIRKEDIQILFIAHHL